MTEPSPARVECYSGHVYAQEPRALVWNGRRLVVVAVQARWRTPAGPAFRVKTEAGQRFDLAYDEGLDRWTIQDLPSSTGRPPADLPITTEDREVQENHEEFRC